MEAIDHFAWHLANVEGVQKVITLPMAVKVVNSGWNEGNIKWRILPSDRYLLRQGLASIPTDTGLRNDDCSAIPILVFTADHKAETIARIVSEVKGFQAEHGSEDVRFRLATGNVGVMAATNQAVSAAQFPMLMWVFAAIILLCLVTFRSAKATLAIVIPLGLVSLLAYALMAFLEIGLKTSTLPVVALGVGIGVDYGIYMISRLREEMQATGGNWMQALRNTQDTTGSAVIVSIIVLLGSFIPLVGTTLANTWGLSIYIGWALIIDVFTALMLLPLMVKWFKPKYVFEA